MRILPNAEKSLGVECQLWSENLLKATVSLRSAAVSAHRTGRGYDAARVGHLNICFTQESF